MDISTLDYPQSSKLVKDYLNSEQNMDPFFEYNPHDKQVYSERYSYLQTRGYDRQALVSYLRKFNKKHDAPGKVLDNIQRLENDDSVVVVGGQQAGLLTGPSYTIHKCLSVIELAKQQEEALGVPVIPVFWIAGEDHDFHEINHVFVCENDTLKKKSYHDFVDKKPATKIVISQKKMKQWLAEIMASYGETKYTKPLLDRLNMELEKSDTIVDFFAKLLHYLFGEYGLVLMDSGDPDLRSIEKKHFKTMIDKNREINEAVLKQREELMKHDYQPTIDQSRLSVNLFYEVEEDRELLEWVDGCFRGKNNTCLFTYEDLQKIAEENPERLSNNVVTRPLMQELLLPTLAFIAGPGEISYWATLKTAFQSVSCVMPPVISRLNVTLVDRTTQKWLDEKALSVKNVIINGLQDEKEKWLKDKDEWDIEAHISQALEGIAHCYQPLHDLASDIDPQLNMLCQKNLEYIKGQIHYLKEKMDKGLKKRYDHTLSKFDTIEMMLKPLNKPQERVWNIFYFMNLYGDDLVHRLLNQSYEFNNKHYICYL